MPNKLQQSTMTEQIYSYLRDQIVEHSIKPGTRLVVNKIAKELGVSASPVRETLRLLQQDGLASMHPHRGAVSIIPTKKGFVDLFKVRRELESMAVREISKLINDDLMKELDSIFEESREAVEKGDKNKWSEMDDRFHSFFRENCDNNILRQMLSKITVWVTFYRNLVYGSPAGRESLEEHCQVIEKVRQRDAEGAAAMMAKHIDRALDAGINKLEI